MLGEDPRHVERHIAGAEHRDRLGGERPGARRIGVPVVPGDEVGRAERAGQVDARDVESDIEVGPRGHDHSVVRGTQLVDLDVHADLDVAPQPDARVHEHLVQGIRDLADAGMVGRDAVADETIRCRELLEQVDRCGRHPVEQDVGRVDARGPRADDGDARFGVGHACSPCGASAAMIG